MNFYDKDSMKHSWIGWENQVSGNSTAAFDRKKLSQLPLWYLKFMLATGFQIAKYIPNQNAKQEWISTMVQHNIHSTINKESKC